MEKERLRFCIERFDHYYDTVNNKSNVQLALSVFVTGGLITLCPYLEQKVNCSATIHFLLGVEIFLGLGSVLLNLLATMPYLGTKNDSLHYFGSIAKLSKSQFFARSAKMNSGEEIEDLRAQVLALANGLKNKFSKLRVVSWLIIAQFIVAVPLLMLLYLNLKKQ
ncbi:Pycsar system effector family protein [Arcticibacter sp. MXS-1]|uniref:Pycsar system effector family protein n=1 Tax=Arcticibacter sp. MXS-1 TaxID=3341726 RepID=UPI0035A86874